MARGRKTGGRNFQEGHGIGRPKLSNEVKAIRKLSTSTFIEVTNELVFMTYKELKKRMKEPNVPVLELLVGKSIEKAISTGNINTIQSILDRLVDKNLIIEQPLESCMPIVNFICGSKPRNEKIDRSLPTM